MRGFFVFIILITIFCVGCTKEPPTTVINSTPPAPKPYHPVGVPYAAIQYGSNLIVGGPEYIDNYNGTVWSSFASITGTSFSVNAFVIYNGNLIAGGTFSSIGGVSANNIAQWNGSTWSALGSGIKGTINALAICNGNIVAGGSFDSAGGVSANNIAEWNGTNWSALGTGMSGIYLNCLAIYNGSIFAGSDQSLNITEWNGISWDSIGYANAGMGALCTYNGNLIEGSLSGYLQQWNGTSWSTLCTIPNTYELSALALYNGNLVVATKAAPDAYDHISAFPEVYLYNGSNSVCVGGFGGVMFAVIQYYINGFTTYNGNLIVFGYLTSGNVLLYNGSTWAAL